MTLITILGACSRLVAIECVDLDPPPLAAVDALESANDPDVDTWVVKLSNHYRKLELC